jgi:hypothetical protein
MSARLSNRLTGVLLALAASMLLAQTTALAAEHASDRARFRIDAELTAQPASGDGRYTLRADVRFAPQHASLNGRYTLHSVHAATCDPLPDAIFANGFE